MSTMLIVRHGPRSDGLFRLHRNGKFEGGTIYVTAPA